MAKRAKPKSPEEILAEAAARRRQAFEAVNLSPEAADLLAHAEVQITRAGDRREGQTVKEDSARRLDAFSALKDGMAKGCYDAARKYERQLLIRRGEGDRGRPMERLDGKEPSRDRTDSMIEAAEWIEAVNAKLPPRDWWLLMELICPSRDLGGWRETVAYITGETHANSQGTAVRCMTVNLRDAIEAVEKARADVRRAA